VVTGSVQYMAPSLSLQIRMFGYSPFFICLCFSIPSLIYALCSSGMYLLTQKLPKRLVIISGFAVLTVGMWLVGQSKILGLQDDADFVLLGLCLIGAAASMISIPVMPECLEAIEED